MSHFGETDDMPDRIGKVIGDAIALAVVGFLVVLLLMRFF
jgi:hypothetical protein